jgi:hypothetical protein
MEDKTTLIGISKERGRKWSPSKAPTHAIKAGKSSYKKTSANAGRKHEPSPVKRRLAGKTGETIGPWSGAGKKHSSGNTHKSKSKYSKPAKWGSKEHRRRVSEGVKDAHKRKHGVKKRTAKKHTIRRRAKKR